MHKPTSHTDTSKPAEATAITTYAIETQRTKNDHSRSSAADLQNIADELHAMFEEDPQLNKAFNAPLPTASGMPPRAGFDHNNDEVNGQQQRRNGNRVWSVIYDGIDFDAATPTYMNLAVDNIPQYDPAIDDIKLCLSHDMYLQVEINDKKGNIRILRRFLLNEQQEEKEEEEEKEAKEAKRARA